MASMRVDRMVGSTVKPMGDSLGFETVGEMADTMAAVLAARVVVRKAQLQVGWKADRKGSWWVNGWVYWKV